MSVWIHWLTFQHVVLVCVSALLTQHWHVTLACVWQVSFSQCVVWNAVFIGKWFSREWCAAAVITRPHPSCHSRLTATNSSTLLQNFKTNSRTKLNPLDVVHRVPSDSASGSRLSLHHQHPALSIQDGRPFISFHFKKIPCSHITFFFIDCCTKIKACKMAETWFIINLSPVCFLRHGLLIFLEKLKKARKSPPQKRLQGSEVKNGQTVTTGYKQGIFRGGNKCHSSQTCTFGDNC